jgi:phasin family protein
MNGKTPRPLAEQAMQGMPALDGSAATAAVEAWMSFNRPMLAAVTELNGRFVDQVSKANHEIMGFVSRRLNEDIATSQRLLSCRNMQDFFAAYSEFFQRAQQQYQAEFQHFARLNQKLADDTASIMKSRMEEMGEEMSDRERQREREEKEEMRRH